MSYALVRRAKKFSTPFSYVTINAAQVCKRLADRSKPLPRKEIEAGKQCAFNHVVDVREDELEDMVKGFGGPFVVDIKFDGWRLQVRHRGVWVSSLLA